MNKKWVLLLSITAVSLCGCSFIKKLIFGDDDSSEPIHYVTSLPEPQIDHGDGYDKYKSFSYNLRDVCQTYGQKPLASTGNQKVLVIPVEFTGSAYKWNNYKRDSIRKCFFADPSSSDIGWESVSSFYKKSSYGKLNISGELGPTFTSSYTYSQMDAKEHPDRYLVDEFEASSAYSQLRKDYDVDGDGYIDSIAFIYCDPIKVSSTDMRWWAFVYTNDSSANVDNPTVNQYMWASYYFNEKATVSNPHGGQYNLDAHTYIHEFGHLMGLDDYYCYDDNNYYDPSGGQEMHSQNIGDENIYSKLCLGWVEPYYVKPESSVTLTLRTSSMYGDAIIINDNWNGTPMDEYLIIEYYSPTGLNEKDSQQEYAKNARMFQTTGFRIYHVDSRLVAYNKVGNKSEFVKRLDTIDPNYYNFVGASNSASYSYLKDVTEKENFKLLHFLQSGGKNTFKSHGDKAVDADLFKQGASFVASSGLFYNGTKFNAGNEVGYRITIGQCDPLDGNGKPKAEGTITITRL